MSRRSNRRYHIYSSVVVCASCICQLPVHCGLIHQVDKISLAENQPLWQNEHLCFSLVHSDRLDAPRQETPIILTSVECSRNRSTQLRVHRHPGEKADLFRLVRSSFSISRLGFRAASVPVSRSRNLCRDWIQHVTDKNGGQDPGYLLPVILHISPRISLGLRRTTNKK